MNDVKPVKHSINFFLSDEMIFALKCIFEKDEKGRKVLFERACCGVCDDKELWILRRLYNEVWYFHNISSEKELKLQFEYGVRGDFSGCKLVWTDLSYLCFMVIGFFLGCGVYVPLYDLGCGVGRCELSQCRNPACCGFDFSLTFFYVD